MKKIINGESIPTTMLASVKDTAYVGIILKGNKFIVVIRNSSTTPYALMDKDTRVSNITYSSVQHLLEKSTYDEAFEFDDATEMYKWFSE